MISRINSSKHGTLKKLKREPWVLKKKSMFLFSIFLTLTLTLSYLVSPVKSSGKETAATSSSTNIAYSLTDFANGKAKYFQYITPNGKTIRYFIVKSSDGKIRAAFDACDVCWPSGKGYVQEGDFMVCRNCGRRFPTPQVNVVTGGCNPAALNRQVSKTQVTIQVKDILEGQKYFNF